MKEHLRLIVVLVALVGAAFGVFRLATPRVGSLPSPQAGRESKHDASSGRRSMPQPQAADLVRVSAADPFEVRVVDSDGSFVEGATIRSGATMVASADDDGYARFGHKSSGPLAIEVAHPAFLPASAVLDPKKESSDVVLRRAFGLKVIVIGRGDEAIGGVAVRVAGERSADSRPREQVESTDEFGVAEFAMLAAGDFRVAVDAANYLPIAFSPQFRAGKDGHNGLPSGFCRLPDVEAVTIRVATPSVACARIVGDELVQHWWEIRLAPGIATHSIAQPLRALREELLARHEGAIARVWMEPGRKSVLVKLHAFLRHGGWRVFDVPVGSDVDTRPYAFHADRLGADQTGTVSVSGGLIPVMVSASTDGHGMTSVKVASGGSVRLPLGNYSVSRYPTAQAPDGLIVIEPAVLDLTAESRDIRVRVIARQELAKVRCHFFMVAESEGGTIPLNGATIEVSSGQDHIMRVATTGSPVDVWLPVSQELEWRTRVLVGGVETSISAIRSVSAEDGELELVLR